MTSRLDKFLSMGACELVLVIGTTAVFDYIVNWALAAKGSNGRLIEINPEQTPISQFATETLRAPAAKALPTFLEDLLQ